jgi:hypothetical protein
MSANPFDETETTQAAHDNGAGIDLSIFDDDYEAAEAPSFEEVPDGKYQTRIQRAALTHAQSSGEPMIKWDLVVISGELEGRHIFKNAVLTNKTLPFIKGDLLKLGLELTRISELPDRIAEVLDKAVEITVRTKGEYTNVYFNKLLDIPPATAGEIPW